jgi:hypothetical protein
LTFIGTIVANITLCSIVISMLASTGFPRDVEYKEGRFRADGDWILIIVLLALTLVCFIGFFIALPYEMAGTLIFLFTISGAAFIGLTVTAILLAMSDRNPATALDSLEALLRRMAPACINDDVAAWESECSRLKRLYFVSRNSVFGLSAMSILNVASWPLAWRWAMN